MGITAENQFQDCRDNLAENLPTAGTASTTIAPTATAETTTTCSNQSSSIHVINSGPLFQIKKWNLIAYWKWDVHSDVCAICRANVMDACPCCQSVNRTSDCVIVWGTCNHSFHNCCIVKWLKRNNRCPLCQQDWKDSRKRQLN